MNCCFSTEILTPPSSPAPPSTPTVKPHHPAVFGLDAKLIAAANSKPPPDAINNTGKNDDQRKSHRKLASTDEGTIYDMLNGAFRPPNDTEAAQVGRPKQRVCLITVRPTCNSASPPK